MAAAHRGGPVQRAIMALTASLGITDDGIAAHLTDATGEGHDRSLVSRWRGGSRHMPVDAVVEIARYASACGDDPEARVVERLLGPLARALGAIVVRVPEAAPARCHEVVVRVLSLGSALGDLEREAAERYRDGEFCESDRARLAELLREIIAQAKRLLSVLEAGEPVRLREAQ